LQIFSEHHAPKAMARANTRRMDPMIRKTIVSAFVTFPIAVYEQRDLDV
jgi:hypothetical protein